ncbi:MAG: transposase [Caldimonas sp.]
MYSRSAPRRRHGVEFKAKVLADCNEPGASISGVALAHGLNANLVRQWRAGRGVKLADVMPAVVPNVPRPREVQASSRIGADPQFVAIAMPAPPEAARSPSVYPMDPTLSSTADRHIQVELRRGPLHLNVRWPTAAAEDCRAWLRELTSGLLK